MTTKSEGAKKKPVTVHVREDLLAEARGAVYVIPGLTFTGLVDKALAGYIKTLRRRNNGGKPFKKRAALSPGRK
jgi:hypothetical protein